VPSRERLSVLAISDLALERLPGDIQLEQHV
jgi:hypothetical protein